MTRDDGPGDELEHLLDLAMVPTRSAAGGYIWTWECVCGQCGASVDLPHAVHEWLIHKGMFRSLVRPAVRTQGPNSSPEQAADEQAAEQLGGERYGPRAKWGPARPAALRVVNSNDA
jgi:hypothetical protein